MKGKHAQKKLRHHSPDMTISQNRGGGGGCIQGPGPAAPPWAFLWKTHAQSSQQRAKALADFLFSMGPGKQ